MINFPNAPTGGQVYTIGGTSWAWDGVKWTAASGGSTAYAPLASPTFTGDARAVTPATADNDTSIATTAYVQAQGYATSAAMTTADNLRVLKAGDTMTGPLVVKTNTGTLPAPVAGTLLQLGNADGTASDIELQSAAGSAVSAVNLYRTAGTMAAKTGLGLGQSIGAIGARGYDGTADSPVQAQVRFTTVNAWGTGDHSTQIAFDVTGAGGTTMGAVATIAASGCALPGTNTNNNAAAGQVGEYVASQVVYAGRTSITTGTQTNVTTISLTAGDWMVGGSVFFAPTAAITTAECSVSTTSATGADPSLKAPSGANGGAGFGLGNVAPTQRLSLAAPATVYLVASVTLGSGTCQVCGLLWARRIR